jgi:hypothetical protein
MLAGASCKSPGFRSFAEDLIHVDKVLFNPSQMFPVEKSGRLQHGSEPGEIVLESSRFKLES